jgi:CRP-like cAMP-binding protein
MSSPQQSDQQKAQPAEPLDPRRNLILRALPDEEYDRLTEAMELVSLKVRDAVYQRNGDIDAVYFPVDGVLSLVATVEDEAAVEVATIGYEGMSGLPAFLGTATSPHECFCQIEGHAMCLPTHQLKKVLQDNGALHNLLHRYTQVIVVMLSQGVACNRLHTTEERCARWLLQTRDRVGADEYTLTQEFLAQMLGVRRGTVSLTAGVLQQAGLIRFSRGRMKIVDPDGLHQVSCDCYDLVREEFRRVGLLPDPDDEAAASGS